MSERSASLAASFRREDVVLGKAALLVERTFSTFAGNIPLLVVVHRSKPRFGMLRLLAIISLHRRKCRPCFWKRTAGFRNSRNTRSLRTLTLI